MKIVVTYEKADILRLVMADMNAQGIKLKEGTSLEYKGAMEVKFSVETEDAPAAPTVPTPSREEMMRMGGGIVLAGADEPPTLPENPTGDSVQGDDMDTVLAASRRLPSTPPLINGAPPRSLGPNESTDPHFGRKG